LNCINENNKIMKKLIVLATLTIASLGWSQENIIKFKADITNKNGDILFIKNGRMIVKEIKGDSNGHFEGSFEAKNGMYSLYDGVEYASLYLKSGYDLYMKMDASKFDETITFTGVGADENNFLAKKTINEAAFDYDSILELKEAEFNTAISSKSAAFKKTLESSKLDADFIAIQKTQIEGEEKGIKQYYNEKQAKSKFIATTAPTFEYENHAGGKSKLEDFKGKYIYIDVWATWCGPCRAEIPSLKKIEEKYHGKNIAFLSISVDTDKDHEKWKTFVTEKQLGGVQLFADKNWNSDFIKHFEINSIPRFLLIDPTGKVINADADRPSNPKLQKTLDALLK